MSFVARLNRLPIRQTQKWLQNSMINRNASSSTKLPKPNTLGRQKSIKFRRNRVPATLSDSFLRTNYMQPTSLSSLPDKYASFIPDYVLKELEYSVRSGLSPKGTIATFNHTDHIAISIPNTGACYLQDHIVRQLSAKTNADLFVLDPQDFVSIAQQNFSRDVAAVLPILSSVDPESNVILALSQSDIDDPYENSKENQDDTERGNSDGAYEIFVKSDNEKEDDGNNLPEDDQDENIEDTLEDDRLKINVHPSESSTNRVINMEGVEIDLDDIYGNGSQDQKAQQMHKISKSTLNQVSSRYTSMFKKLLSNGSISKSENKESGTIIYLRDYGSMQDAFTRIMLKSLLLAVEDLKQRGHRLMIVASYCLKPDLDEILVPAIPNLRYISVLPSFKDKQHVEQWKTLMKQDEISRAAEINAKQVLAVYRQKNILETQSLQEQEELLTSLISSLKKDSMSKSVWTPKEVDRRVTTAIGHALESSKTKLELDDLIQANKIVGSAIDLRDKAINTLKSTMNVKLDNDGSIDMNYLKRSCNEYERKLLSRIVDPSKVHGSFRDVRAPPSTIETLQSLISFPLLYPELFCKGILKKNFIPGVLLFGPPGTGKTMLAKAVAKESGSRMLDIQASDVYDMYVGQGEKNVKAIFSLARKLSPCVIFIDEVDSLMNKRGSDYSSKSHREIINQFMVEWDGLSSNNQGVVVMAATNRPFDLDDAVLRRMPRRILVDLPNEQDRAEILKVLLQDEQHEVPIEDVAKATEHYSGSDLKNVCVTAALKAVQQQVTTKIPQSLRMEHFEEALKMVPPSSSEEMDSLVEIRKWDSKFGDGKKKPKTTIGF
ncbi:P-loop containing nucleoside triphosphate hydrolase protein [Choanephora cucurbitarum]|nr:P-loop containing nucleoside triphosphate hydrolase protein [Choanephora cucurbitarum]